MNVLVLTRAPGSACEYYRGIGVLSKIKGVNLRLEPEVGWSVLSQVDLVFAERPISQSDLDIITMAKDFNVPVWVDVDDDFFSVPAYNPARRTYWNKENQERHAQCLALADIVTVTCEHLKGELLDFNPKIRVVPNAFNNFHWKWEFKPGENHLVAWRGSATHRDDVRTYLGSMLSIQQANEMGWAFIGNDLWFVSERMDPEKAKFMPEMPTTQYWKAIKEFGASYWHVPLLDNKFNRSKSNIGWIEATYAGAVCLGPDMEEWRKPGVFLYEPEKEPTIDPGCSESYSVHLALMIALDDNARIKALKQSFDYISENLLLSKVNEQRKAIMEELCAS